MDSLTTVLVTGGGAPGIAGTLAALRAGRSGTIRTVTTDIADGVVGKYLADAFHVAPPPEEAGYVAAMLDICTRERVSVILPQTTREIAVLSRERETFAAHGIPVVVSGHEAITAANDKHRLLQIAEEMDVPVPVYRLARSEEELRSAARELGYPDTNVVIKPLVSNGMRGLRILTETPWDVARFLAEKPDGVEAGLEEVIAVLRRGDWPALIVSEYLPGAEYTVDAFRGARGVCAIPRIREKIRSGITFDARVELRRDIIDWSVALSEKLDLRYCFGFQFKLDRDGVPKLLECNPRVQGTMAVGRHAGFNMILAAVHEALGVPDDPGTAILRDGVSFKRFWGGVFIDDSGRTGTIQA